MLRRRSLLTVGFDSLSENLLAHWPFSGNANDETGNGNDGTVSGATLTTDKNGSTDSAYLFNGTSDYIEIGDKLDMGFSDYSVSAWIYPTAFSGLKGIFGKTKAQGAAGRYAIFLVGDEVRAFVDPDGLGVVSAVYTLPSINSWYSIVGLWDRDVGISLYIDGVLQDFTATDTSSYDMNNILITRIGCYNDSNDDPANFFSGKIDNVRVYDRLLDTQEITKINNGYR